MATRPLVPKQHTAPEGSHLAVLTDVGTVRAFPIGTTFVFIGDADDKETWIPMVLVKATMKRWTFRCACGKPKCTQVYTYSVSRQGHHPYA